MRNAQLVHQQSNRLLLLLAFTLSLVGLLVLARFSVAQAQQPAPQTVYLPLVVGVPPTNSHSPVGLTDEPPLQAPGTVVEWKTFTVTLDTHLGSNDKEGIPYEFTIFTSTTGFTGELVCLNGKSLDTGDLEERRKALQSTYDNIVRGGLCVGRSATSGLFKAGLEKFSTFAPGQPYLSWADETKDTGILTLTSDYQSRQLMVAIQDLLRRSSDAGPLTVTERLYRKMAGLPLPNGTTENWATSPDILLLFDSSDCNKGVGHALLPYKVEYLANEARIYVYDPNYPISETVYLIPDWDGPTGIPSANAINETETVPFTSPFAIRLEGGNNIPPIDSRKVSWQWVFTYTKSIAPNDVWGIYAPSQVFTLTSKRDNTVLTPTVPLSPTWTRETGAFSLTWVSNFTLTKNLPLTHTWVITAPTQVVTVPAKDKAKVVKNPFAYNRYITVYKDNTWSYPFNSYDGTDGIWKNWSFYYIPVNLLQQQKQAEGMKKLGGPDPTDYSLLTGGAGSRSSKSTLLTGGAGSRSSKSALLTGGAGSRSSKSALLTGGAGSRSSKSGQMTGEPDSSSSSPKADLNRCLRYFSEGAFAPIVGGGGLQRVAYGDPSATWGKDHKPFCFGQPPVANPNDNKYRVDGQNSVFNYEGTLNVTGTTCLNIRNDFKSFGIYISGTQELTAVHQDVRGRVQHTYEDGATRSAELTALMPLLKGEFITITLQGNAVTVFNWSPITKTVAMLLGFKNAKIETEYKVKPIDVPPYSRVVFTAWDWSRLEDTLIVSSIGKNYTGVLSDSILQDTKPMIVRYPFLYYTAREVKYEKGKPPQEVDVNKRDDTIYLHRSKPLNFSILPSTCPVAKIQYKLEYTGPITGGSEVSDPYANPYFIKDTGWLNYTLPVTVSPNLPDAKYQLTVESYDTVNNHSNPIHHPVVVYSQIPSTTATLEGELLDKGIYSDQVTVTLRATSYLYDRLGIKYAQHKTYYRLNGGEWKLYEKPVSIAQDGTIPFEYYTLDATGITEPIQTLNLRVNRRVVTIIPLNKDPNLYRKTFEQLGMLRRVLQTLQAPQIINGKLYPAGTIIAEGVAKDEVKGSETIVLSSTEMLTGTMTLPRAPKVALIGSESSWQAEIAGLVKNKLALDVTLLRANEVTEDNLAKYDLVLLPAISSDKLEAFKVLFGATGREALRTFAQSPGKTLYFQGLSTSLIAWLDERFNDTANTTNLRSGNATVSIVDQNNPLTFNLFTDKLELADSPALKAGLGLSATLVLSDSTPVMLEGNWGQGRIVLMAGHPTIGAENPAPAYILLANVLLTAVQEPLNLRGFVQQIYSEQMERDQIPYVLGATVAINRFVQLSSTQPVTKVTVVETLATPFELVPGSVSPEAQVVTDLLPVNGVNYTRTKLVWNLTLTQTGQVALKYKVELQHLELLKSVYEEASRATLTYETADGLAHDLKDQILVLRMALPANLQTGPLDTRQDLYPLPKEGLITDYSVVMRNTEGTRATNIGIEVVVPLIAPAINLQDAVLANPSPTSPSGQPALVRDKDGKEKLPLFKNTIKFLQDSTRYPLPIGVANPQESRSINDWDGTTVYTITVNRVIDWDDILPGDLNVRCDKIVGKTSLPARDLLKEVIKIIPKGDKTLLVLPAMVLRWDYGAMPGYDFESPARRINITTQEYYERSIALSGAGILNQDLEFTNNTEAVAVLVQLGTDNVPFVLRTEWKNSIPKYQGSALSKVLYDDLWGRTHRVDFPMKFLWLIRHANGAASNDKYGQVETTFSHKLYADQNKDGRFEKLVPDFNLADTQILLKGTIAISTTGNKVRSIRGVLPLFKGLSWQVTPFDGVSCLPSNRPEDWAKAVKITKGGDITRLIEDEVRSDNLYDYLPFEIMLNSDLKANIEVNACISVSEDPAKRFEGPMKFTDGMLTTYANVDGSATRLNFFATPPDVIWGIESNMSLATTLSKPIVHTDYDEVTYILTLKDENDPRDLRSRSTANLASTDEYLKTEGSESFMDSVFVGGRAGTQTYKALLNPDYSDTSSENVTAVRYYLINTSNDLWQDVDVKVITDTVLANTGTLANDLFKIGNIFACRDPKRPNDPVASDIPGWNRRVVAPGQSTTFWFKVTGITTTEALRGRVYPVKFKVTGKKVGGESFEYPLTPAMIGLVGKNGELATSYGPATEIQFLQTLPPFITPLDIRFTTEANKITQLKACWYSGQKDCPALSALTKIEPVKQGTSLMMFVPQQQTFEMQSLVPQFPLANATAAQNQAFLVLKARVQAHQEGYFPFAESVSATYLDYQGIKRTVTAPDPQIRVSGAVLNPIAFDDRGMEAKTYPVINGLIYGRYGEITTTLKVHNTGGKLAQNATLTVTVGSGAKNVKITVDPLAQDYTMYGNQIVWNPGKGNVAPDSAFFLPLTVQILSDTAKTAPLFAGTGTPTATVILTGTFNLIDKIDVSFRDDGGKVNWTIETPILPYLVFPDLCSISRDFCVPILPN